MVADAAPKAAVVPPSPADAAAPMSEAGARILLSRAFRAAGYRILNDVPVRGAGYQVTLDGFDPKRKVGFEYVDPRERGADLDTAERAALARSELKVLIVDAAHGPAVEAMAKAFLRAHPRKKK
jgi:hypothetical protein